MASKRDAYRRRGRAALLGAGAVFAVVQFAAGLLLDWRGLPVRFPSAARALAAAPRGDGRPDVVLLGSSRMGGVDANAATAVLRHEHPEAGPVEVYNAAVPAGDPIAEDYVLAHLLAQGSRPRLAVVEVSPDFVIACNPMFSMHCHRQIVWRDTPYYFVDVCRAGELRKLAASRLVPLYAHRRELLKQAGLTVAGFFSPPPPPAPPATPDLGLEPGRPVPWNALVRISDAPPGPAQVQSLAAQARACVKHFRDYQPGGTTAAALERLVRRCRDHGVAVVLVGAPSASFLRQDYTPDVDAAYLGYMSRLTTAYGCRFIDCRDSVPDSAFKDLVHLQSEGGRYFACKLAHDIISPWLRGEQLAAVRR